MRDLKSENSHELGVLTIAVGADKYIRQAEVLCMSLRRNMPDLKIAVVTDNQGLNKFADFTIPVDRSMPIATAQKLLLDRYTPFKETLFIDADCVVSRRFDNELVEIRKYEFSPIVDRWLGPSDNDPYVIDLAIALKMVRGSLFPKFNGGVYFFKSGELSKNIFAAARFFHRNAEVLGIRSFDKGGAGDETVLALAMAQHGDDKAYSDGGRLMRTPTGLKGSIWIDPFGGGSRFERHDGIAEPAICHFAGPYQYTYAYASASWALRNNQPVVPALRRLDLSQRVALSRTEQFLRYKWHGLGKRLNKIESVFRATRPGTR